MTRTAIELAKFLGCALEGDGQAPLSGVAAPGSARATDLIYVETPRHLDRAASSSAKCVLLAPGLALEGKTLLRSANPKLAVCARGGLATSASANRQGDSSDRSACPFGETCERSWSGAICCDRGRSARSAKARKLERFVIIGRDAHLGKECRLTRT